MAAGLAGTRRGSCTGSRRRRRSHRSWRRSADTNPTPWSSFFLSSAAAFFESVSSQNGARGGGSGAETTLDARSSLWPRSATLGRRASSTSPSLCRAGFADTPKAASQGRFARARVCVKKPASWRKGKTTGCERIRRAITRARWPLAMSASSNARMARSRATRRQFYRKSRPRGALLSPAPRATGTRFAFRESTRNYGTFPVPDLVTIDRSNVLATVYVGFSEHS